MTAQRMAVIVIPTVNDATVRYRNPLIVGALSGVAANQAAIAGENRLSPQSAVAPGTRYAINGPKLALVTL